LGILNSQVYFRKDDTTNKIFLSYSSRLRQEVLAIENYSIKAYAELTKK